MVNGTRDTLDYMVEIEAEEFKNKLTANGDDIKKTISLIIHEDYEGFCPVSDYQIKSIKRYSQNMLVELKKKDKLSSNFRSGMKFLVFFNKQSQNVSQNVTNLNASFISNED